MLGRRIVAALLASSLTASPALADSKPPSEKDRQAANDLVKRAIAKSDAGEHAEAIEIYRKAYTIVPNVLLLSNIASEYEKSGKLLEALRYFCMYMSQDPSGTMVPYATSRARALQIKLGNEDVDDRDMCTPPRPDRREPRQPKQPVEPEPTERPRRPPASPPPEPTTTTPTNSFKYGAVVSGVAGLAAIAVGGYAGVRARAISDEISSHDRSRPWPDDIRELERRGQTFENVQIGGLVAGGLLVTTATILYVVSRSRSSSESSDSAVTLAPTTNGVVVLGWF
jgi:hypothetical protein